MRMPSSRATRTEVRGFSITGSIEMSWLAMRVSLAERLWKRLLVKKSILEASRTELKNFGVM